MLPIRRSRSRRYCIYESAERNVYAPRPPMLDAGPIHPIARSGRCALDVFRVGSIPARYGFSLRDGIFSLGKMLSGLVRPALCLRVTIMRAIAKSSIRSWYRKPAFDSFVGAVLTGDRESSGVVSLVGFRAVHHLVPASRSTSLRRPRLASDGDRMHRAHANHDYLSR